MLARCLGALLTAILCCQSFAICQADTIDDAGLWFAYFSNGDLSEFGHEGTGLKWWFDAHLRYLEDSDGFNQSILRPGIGWEIAEDQTLWAGYGWIANSPINGNNFDEHRLWQQWIKTAECCDKKYMFRSRFEQRWDERGDDVGLRFRQLVRAQKQISECPYLTFVLWDEVFVNLNDTDWGAEAGFDQNRAFVGLGFKTCECQSGRIEVGYLNQAINRPVGDDRMNHILSINFFR